jgi:hypothetical protein
MYSMCRDITKIDSLAKYEYIERNITRWFFRIPILNLFVLYSMRIAVIIDGEELKTALTRIYSDFEVKMLEIFPISS